MNTNLLIEVHTDAPLESVCARLPEISQKHAFGVLGVHDLKEKMVTKGIPFERECRIFEVCNPHQAHKILQSEMSVSTALPCRISVYQEHGKTVLATIKPTAFLALFDMPGAETVASEVEETLTAIMEETAHPTVLIETE